MAYIGTSRNRQSLQPDERVIRVFVSSTFRDMQEERDELVLRVFPQLRRLCEQRGVTWSEIDLRWGITEEQSHRGEVLPICLEEIRRCRPYFIGLLGERYGWVPASIPQELVESQPWLEEHREKSVTELEIIHGVLNNPTLANRACFYFRDPRYLDRVRPEQRADYLEENEEARAKLASLKDRIKHSDIAWRDSYPDPKTLGKWVLEDLTVAINQQFPPELTPSPLEREHADHEAFARRRTASYIGRDEYFSRLDAYVAEGGQPLVVLGESGSGKSALLANWATRHRERHPKDSVLLHFIGSSSDSANWAAMIRRIMSEMKRRFNIEQDLPSKPDELRQLFANWLHMASASTRLVLVIDALNQLEDRDGALDLVWLPPQMPANVRLIVSTLPGRALDSLSKRGCPSLHVEPLTAEERVQLICHYLSKYSKRLSEPRARRITSCPQTANPLYLRILLEELRIFGVHEEIDVRIDHYLEATSVVDLYKRILERYERDYGNTEGWVRDALSLLWSSRRGLSEAELRDLLGRENLPLPQMSWSAFYLAAEESLVTRSGLIDFSHNYIRQAVQERYLASEEAKRAAHRRLAAFFAARGTDLRSLEELPWQIMNANQSDQLYDLLRIPIFFQLAWDVNEFDIKSYWTFLESTSRHRMEEAYREVINTPAHSEVSLAFVERVGRLLHDTGRTAASVALWTHLSTQYRGAKDLRGLQQSLLWLAQSLTNQSQLERALEIITECEHLSRRLNDQRGLARSLGMRAYVVGSMDRFDDAWKLLTEQEQLLLHLEDSHSLQECVHRLGQIQLGKGELDAATAQFERQERICREINDVNGVAQSLGGQGAVLLAHKQWESALQLLKQEESLLRQLGNKNALITCLGMRQTQVYRAYGALEQALALVDEADMLVRQFDSKHGLINILREKSEILEAKQDLAGASQCLLQALKVAESLGKDYPRDRLSTSCHKLATLYNRQGMSEEALKVYRWNENLCVRFGDNEGLANCACFEASLLNELERFDEAARKYDQSASLFWELGDFNTSLKLKLLSAKMLKKAHKYHEAVECLREAMVLAQAQEATDTLSNMMGTFSELIEELVSAGQRMEAVQCSQEYLALCPALKEPSRVATGLMKHGTLQLALGQYETAFRSFQAAERQFESARKYSLAISNILFQAGALLKSGRCDEGVPLLARAFAQIQHCPTERPTGSLCGAIGQFALAYVNRGEREKANSVLKNGAGWMEELNEPIMCARLLCYQGSTLSNMGRRDESVGVLKRALVIVRTSSTPVPELETSIVSQLARHGVGKP